MIKYPNVACADHPGIIEPGYMVCVHVLQDKLRMEHLERATPTELGVACCQACLIESQNMTLNGNFRIACAAGLREQGLLASA